MLSLFSWIERLLSFLWSILAALVNPVCDLWTRLTAVDNTAAGKVIEAAMWGVVGIIGLLLVLGTVGGMATSAISHTIPQKEKYARMSGSEVPCCSNCRYFDSRSGCCTINGKSTVISSPYDKKCSLFTR